MYCKKCGCKVEIGEKKCSNCGANVQDIEYCGGFWGLVGDEEKIREKALATKTMSIDKAPVTEELKPAKPRASTREYVSNESSPSRVSTKREEKKEKYKFFSEICVAVLVLLLSVSVVQTFRLNSVTKKSTIYKNEYESLKKETQKLEKVYKELKEQNEELTIKLEQETDTQDEQMPGAGTDNQ